MKKKKVDNVERLFPYTDEEILRFKDGCLANIEERKELYDRYRRALFDNEVKNLLFKNIKDIVSLIYLPDNIIFDIIVEPAKSKFAPEIPLDELKKVIEEDFISDKLDILFYQWLFWSLVYGTYLVKVIVDKNSVKLKAVSPYDFGVYYEDNTELDKNQIFCHIVRIPKHLAQRKYPGAIYTTVNPPRREEQFIDLVLTQQKAVPIPDQLLTKFNPKPVGEYVEVYELWIYDHEREDWLMCQCVGDSVYKSVNPFLPKQHPFIKFSPTELEGYFWGLSEMHYLLYLQEKIKNELNEINNVKELLKAPPIIVSGIQTAVEAQEIQEKLDVPKSVIEIADPMAKFEFYLPKLDVNILYNNLKYTEESFKEQSGIMGVISGRPLPNVRSASYAHILAQFASTQLKEKALKAEYFIEAVMTLYAQCLVNIDETFKDIAAIPFRVDVFAHTSSPITALAYQEMLLNLAEIGIVPMEVLIDMLPLPRKDKIKQMANILQYVKAKTSQEEK